MYRKPTPVDLPVLDPRDISLHCDSKTPNPCDACRISILSSYFIRKTFYGFKKRTYYGMLFFAIPNFNYDEIITSWDIRQAWCFPKIPKYLSYRPNWEVLPITQLDSIQTSMDKPSNETDVLDEQDFIDVFWTYYQKYTPNIMVDNHSEDLF